MPRWSLPALRSLVTQAFRDPLLHAGPQSVMGLRALCIPRVLGVLVATSVACDSEGDVSGSVPADLVDGGADFVSAGACESGTWERNFAGVDLRLHSVWGPADDDIWAVGDRGVLLHFGA